MLGGFVPGWLTAECEAALLAIDEERRTRNTALKRRTVIVLADGMAQGESVTALLKRADTCTESTWYGKARGRTPWKEEEAVAGALVVCQKAALKWEDKKVERALAEARARLGLEAPACVEDFGKARGALRGKLADEDANVVIRAATALAEVAGRQLDRAGEETADKSGGVLNVRFVRPTSDSQD